MIEVQFRSDVGVKLVSYVGGDNHVIAAARVSVLGPESEEFLDLPAEESAGLIGFLMKNRHGTPFEHNCMTFLIEAPIMVFREFHRHRIGWSYNEESGRYTELKPVFYVHGEDRKIVQTGKPGHYTFEQGDGRQYAKLVGAIQGSCQGAYETYQHLLAQGIAKEVARSVLPVNIFSSMYATCNARSLMAFLSLRTTSDVSKFPSFPMREIEMVAEEMEDYFATLFPITYEAFNFHGRVSP